jgi:tripartite-type tricarboxylate transporter receptor subunit TctC
VAPKGLPKDVSDRLLAALEKVHKSTEFNDFMKQRGFGVTWMPPAEFAAFMEKSSNDLGAVMKAVGIVK